MAQTLFDLGIAAISPKKAKGIGGKVKGQLLGKPAIADSKPREVGTLPKA